MCSIGCFCDINFTIHAYFDWKHLILNFDSVCEGNLRLKVDVLKDLFPLRTTLVYHDGRPVGELKYTHERAYIPLYIFKMFSVVVLQRKVFQNTCIYIIDGCVGE